jgi:hypothetical protein
MRFQTVLATTLVIAAAAAAAACSSSAESSGSQKNAVTNSGLCESYCTKLNTCDESADKQTCTNKCKNANAAALPKLRTEIVGDIEACIGAKDCSKVLKGDVINTCASEAVAEVAPSAAATAYCDSLQKTATKCDLTFSRASCLSAAKLYNDETIAEAQSCTDKSCSDVAACVNAALSFGGSSSSSSSSSSSGGSSSSSGGSSSSSGGPSSSSSGSSSGGTGSSSGGSSSSSGAPPPPSRDRERDRPAREWRAHHVTWRS